MGFNSYIKVEEEKLGFFGVDIRLIGDIIDLIYCEFYDSGY